MTLEEEKICYAVPDPNEVLVQSGAWINRTAYRLHVRMPWAEVDDMIQHGVLTALELRERYEPDRGVPFPIYIKPRVFGAMIDISRQTGSIKRREEAYLAEADTVTEDDALETIINCENIDALETEIDELPYEERTVISLFYLEEISNKEVAAIMKITEVKAVRYRQKALSLLAEGIERRLSMTKRRANKIEEAQL